MALGSCDVSLLELANGYAVLARGGIFLPLQLLDAPTAPPVPQHVLSPETCYLIADILGGNERALTELGGRADIRCPRVAWKTGTSTAHRDAWTIAYNPDYVIGVWVGNASGKPTHSLNGLHHAAPLALGIMRDLYPAGNAPWFDEPPQIETRTVCALSGATPTPQCSVRIEAHAIRAISSPQRCHLHH
jgi:penicillin-binding protein 1C